MSPQKNTHPTRPPRSRHHSGIIDKTGPASRRGRARAFIRTGDLALAYRQPERAQDAYAEAIALLMDSDDLTATAYVRLGHALRMVADPDARSCYEMALTMRPQHRAAKLGLLTTCIEAGLWGEVAELEEELFASIHDPAHRCLELLISGDRWLVAADAPARARVRYHRALSANPASRAAQRRSAR